MVNCLILEHQLIIVIQNVAAHLKKKRKAEKENKPVRKRVKCKMTSRENNDEDEPNNSLTFKITTIEKSLDTMFLHPN